MLAGHLRQEEPARYELWKKLIGGEMPPIAQDGLYIFALLYSWGYLPSLEMERRRSKRELPVEEAIQEMENFFYPYLELTPTVQKEIRDYIYEHSQEGIYLQEREFVTAYLCWTV